MTQNPISRFFTIFITVFILSGFFNPAPAKSTIIESRSYFKKVGSEAFNARWQLDKKDKLVVSWEEPREKTYTTTDFSFDTLKWEINNYDKQTFATVTREGNILRVKGVLNGDPIDRTKEIDDCPWYQSTAISLRPFLASERECIEFWYVREETLGIHKIKVIKTGEEILSINGEKIPAQKVKITLTGILSNFWKSNIWYRKSDGVFVRFEGPSGAPGSPRILVELRDQEDLIIPANFEGYTGTFFNKY